MTETLLYAAILIPCLVIAIVFHEVAHGWTALALGDPTAKERRRLTFNPIPHVDPIGTLLVPGAMALLGGPIFGWAKPVPVNQRRLNNPRYGMMLVSAAGPGMNLLLAAIAAIALGLMGAPLALDGRPDSLLQMGLFVFVLINCFLAFFNLLPIPPFDGSHILEGLLPRRWAAQFAQLRQAGLLFFVILVAASWAFPQWRLIERLVGPPMEWMLGIFQTLAAGISG